MNKILLLGATGYLGKHLLEALIQAQQYEVLLILRDAAKLTRLGININARGVKIIEGDLLDNNTIVNTMYGVDTIISTLGITRQKDNLTYMDVDYGVNKMVLDEALRVGVRKFIYISVLHAQKLRHLKICEAKERFVDELQMANIDSTVIRPSGFFSDMGEFMHMAKNGRIYLFGDGEFRANPIDGADLADVCLDAIVRKEAVIEVGGPESLTHNEISTKAFEAINAEVKIVHIPIWLVQFLILTLPLVSSQKWYGPIEFFLHVMSMDMVTNRYGKRKLSEYFSTLK